MASVNMMRYRYLDHTSDLGVEIYGSSLEELFKNALYTIFDNITDLNLVEKKSYKTISISAQSIEDLFMDWLRELIFIFATDFFVAKDVEEISIADGRLLAKVAGEKFDTARHKVKIEIKTPTYHMFGIEKTSDGYKATVIFDV
ncbi:MAG: archease [candidate division WOR-3 bacterium]|nr:archease [candidate division WOR-3 bacterium]